VVAALAERRLTVGTAESLTAGLVSATLADVPGASAVLRGGVVAYAADVKSRVLGVTSGALLTGVVSEAVARQLADGARRVLAADVGIGTTGAAGPEPHGGEPVGSVWIAASGPMGRLSRHLDLTGGREEIRRQTVTACWELVLDLVVRGRTDTPGAAAPGE
jgi:nicotinamide-nucleotide amidase